MTDPEILLLDEPTAGMDAISRRQMWGLLRQLHARKITILLTTHYIDEAQSLCDRVALINKGKFDVIDTPDNLINALGSFAVDQIIDDKLTSRYFAKREDAISYLRGVSEDASLRNTTLEDVFVERIGRRIDQK